MDIWNSRKSRFIHILREDFYRVILASVQEVKSLEFKHYPPLVVKFFDILDGRSAKRAHQAKRGRQGEAAQCDAQLRTK